jgi:hypothetical protein
VLEHVEAVALGLDEVGVLRGAVVGLAAEPPGREDRRADLPGVDGGLRPQHGLGEAVVEVDGEEQSALLGFGQQVVGLASSNTSGFSTRSGTPARSSCRVGSKCPRSAATPSPGRVSRRRSISAMSVYAVVP